MRRGVPKPRDGSLSPLAGEVARFCTQNGFSRRETDVFGQLLDRVTTSEAIGRALGVSPNTVSNHFKSILQKTECSTKVDLLATFARGVLAQQKRLEPFVCRPRVMLVDDEPEICDILGSGLEELGISVFSETDSSAAVEPIIDQGIDVVVSDLRMPGLDGLELMQEVRKRLPYVPAFVFMTGYRTYSQIDCYDRGAVAFLQKPVDNDQVFELIRTFHFARSIVPILASAAAAPPSVTLPVKVDGLGFGGVFVRGEQVPEGVAIGCRVGLELELDGRRYRGVEGEVIWERSAAASQSGAPPGIGVRFLSMPQEELALYEDFVRRNQIMAFIPRGCADR